MTTANEFLNSLSNREEQELFDQIDKLFERDALRFAQIYGFPMPPGLHVMETQKASA